MITELILTAERMPQNRTPEEHLWDRVMKGVKMACMPLIVRVAEQS